MSPYVEQIAHTHTTHSLPSLVQHNHNNTASSFQKASAQFREHDRPTTDLCPKYHMPAFRRAWSVIRAPVTGRYGVGRDFVGAAQRLSANKTGWTDWEQTSLSHH